MPLSADPSDSLPYVRLADRAKPALEQAVFHLWFLSARDARAADRLHEQAVEAENAGDDDKVLDLAVQIVRLGLERWENLNWHGKPVPHTPEADVSGYVTSDQIWELVRAVRIETRLTEKSRKNSESPVPSAPAASAGTADAPAA